MAKSDGIQMFLFFFFADQLPCEYLMWTSVDYSDVITSIGTDTLVSGICLGKKKQPSDSMKYYAI